MQEGALCCLNGEKKEASTKARKECEIHQARHVPGKKEKEGALYRDGLGKKGGGGGAAV